MLNYLKALKLVATAHRGQKDKAGKPYILHPLNVSFGVKGYDAKIVALLHDVFEDTDTKIEDVAFLSDSQREALRLLTHRKGVPYFEYIEQIKANVIAKSVKMSDLRHNSNLRRIKSVSDKDRARLEKYNKAIDILAN